MERKIPGMKTPVVIDEVVVHHAAVPQLVTLGNALKSFNRTHKARLHDAIPNWPQPISSGPYPHIAYNAIIDQFGNIGVARSFDDMGYHASNIKVNRKSIGVCLIGNFDSETPTEAQYEALEKYVIETKKKIPTLKKVSAHRHYARKTCPGTNFPESHIEHLDRLVKGEVAPMMNDESILEKPPQWAASFVDRAIEGGVTTDLMQDFGDLPGYQVLGIMQKHMVQTLLDLGIIDKKTAKKLT